MLTAVRANSRRRLHQPPVANKQQQINTSHDPEEGRWRGESREKQPAPAKSSIAPPQGSDGDTETASKHQRPFLIHRRGRSVSEVDKQRWMLPNEQRGGGGVLRECLKLVKKQLAMIG